MAGLSLEALGVMVGIEEATAKIRIHQYEQEKHAPPFPMLERLAVALKKPVVWFVCAEEDKGVLLKLYALPEQNRRDALQKLERAIDSQPTETPKD
jgi:transcriptional regulator with XRE-family HTH domain